MVGEAVSDVVDAASVAATTGAIAAVNWGHRRFRIKSNYVEANYDSNKSRRDTQSQVDRHDQSSNCRRDRGRPPSAWLVNIVLGCINRLIYFTLLSDPGRPVAAWY